MNKHHFFIVYGIKFSKWFYDPIRTFGKPNTDAECQDFYIPCLRSCLTFNLAEIIFKQFGLIRILGENYL